jgi:glycosyltransferase involved in cell wall biosynthesis
MKVLFLATTFPRWENDTRPAFVYELSKRLQKSGLEIVILAPYGMRIYRFPYFFPTRYQKLAYNGGLLPNLNKSKLAIIQIPFFLASEIIYALKIIRKEKIEIIHSHWIIPNGFVGAVCKRILNIPHFITAYGSDALIIEKSRILRIFGSFVLVNAEEITADSAYTRDLTVLINKSVENSIHVIPMGVDEQRFNKKNRISCERSPDEPVILSVGRLVERKGLKYLIRAMKRVIKTYPDAKLLIGGDGPEKENLMNECSRLELEKNVEFLGFIPNEKIPQIYSSADIFVLPSIVTKSGDTEGLGVVLLEAMASGIPVIGSDIGGITDIIEDRKTGLLVKSEDPDDLAEKILFILSNKNFRLNMSTEAMNLINQKFSWDTVTKQFVEVFKNFSKNNRKQKDEIF